MKLSKSFSTGIELGFLRSQGQKRHLSTDCKVFYCPKIDPKNLISDPGSDQSCQKSWRMKIAIVGYPAEPVSIKMSVCTELYALPRSNISTVAGSN